MNSDLTKLTPVRRGMPMQVLASPERIEAMQNIILDLWEGKNISGRGRTKVQRGNAGVVLDAAEERSMRHVKRWTPLFADGKLRIGHGVIGVGEADGSRIIEPYYPKFQGSRINAENAPSLAIDTLAEGAHKIILKFCAVDGEVEVLPVDEDPDRDQNEWVVLVATFLVRGDGEVREVKHLLHSDIILVAEDCSSSSNNDSSNGDSSNGDSGDSDSSTSDSGSGGSSGEGACCPEITVRPIVFGVTGYGANGEDFSDCFSGSGAEDVLVIVEVTVENNPCNCTRGYVRVRLAGQVQNFYMGGAGVGTVTAFFTISARACQTFGGDVCYYTPSSIDGGADPCHSLLCCEPLWVTMPPICGDGDCGSGSDGGSDGGSGDGSGAGSSGDSSDSGDGSGKTAIMHNVFSKTQYAKMFCAEGTENWFFDVMEWDGNEFMAISKKFHAMTESSRETLWVMASAPWLRVHVVCVGRRNYGVICRRSWGASIAWAIGRCLGVRVFSEAKIMVWGIRRGHDHGKMPDATLRQYRRNNERWED